MGLVAEYQGVLDVRFYQTPYIPPAIENEDGKYRFVEKFSDVPCLKIDASFDPDDNSCTAYDYYVLTPGSYLHHKNEGVGGNPYTGTARELLSYNDDAFTACKATNIDASSSQIQTIIRSEGLEGTVTTSGTPPSEEFGIVYNGPDTEETVPLLTNGGWMASNSAYPRSGYFFTVSDDPGSEPWHNGLFYTLTSNITAYWGSDPQPDPPFYRSEMNTINVAEIANLNDIEISFLGGVSTDNLSGYTTSLFNIDDELTLIQWGFNFLWSDTAPDYGPFFQGPPSIDDDDIDDIFQNAYARIPTRFGWIICSLLDEINFSADIDGNIMSVHGEPSGPLEVGDEILTGAAPGTIITGFRSGTGGEGDYYVSPSQNVDNTNMTIGPKSIFLMIDLTWDQCWRINPIGATPYSEAMLDAIRAGDIQPYMSIDSAGNYYIIGGDDNEGEDSPSLIWSSYTFRPPNGGYQPSPSPAQNPDINRVRSWTFTLDGHDFYVLRLGEDKTIVYDASTEKWSDWATQDWDIWRPSMGCNWGAQDIVAGDLASGLLWNVDPTARLDDGNQLITSILSAHLPIRGLSAASLGAIGTVSLGDPSVEGEGIGIKLETSDNEGVTFTDHGTVPIPIDEYNQPMWLGIGQIAAPGKQFRITDYGTTLSIFGFDTPDG